MVTQAPLTLEAFRGVLEDVLDEQNLDIGESTTAKEVPGWDSLNHVRLLVGIEQAYGINFPIDSVERLENVGELIALVNQLIAEQTGR
jgi:acyl carrier protein